MTVVVGLWLGWLRWKRIRLAVAAVADLSCAWSNLWWWQCSVSKELLDPDESEVAAESAAESLDVLSSRQSELDSCWCM